ncbi:restriction endonuclease subunit S [Nocardia fluminea]|uniref:restriction endonuclease subunit S n=1 Tax=Nocardia fluminea TaxID=134984 RepID=UPI0033F169F0
MTSVVNRGSAPDYIDDGPVRVVSQAANQLAGIDWSRSRFHSFTGNPKDLKGCLRTGDILVNSTGTGTLGRVGYFSGSVDSRPCMADGHVTLVRTRDCDLDSRFAFYWLGSAPFYEYIYAALIVGATNQIELNRDRLRDARIPVPPLGEQRRIADFLDAETSRIDQIVRIRRDQLALVDSSEVSRAFDAIRGRDVGGQRKESGLPWLGSVPEAWRIAAVSYSFDVELGKMLNQDRVAGEYLRPYLRVANVQWDHLDMESLAYMDFPPEEQERYRLRAGDLLVCEGGSWPGRAALWDGSINEMYYQKALHRIRARGNDLSRWLYYCLLVAERLGVFAVQGNTSTMTHLTREQLKPQRFPFPDPGLQAVVVAELDSAHRRDVSMKSLLVRQMELLAERRQSLITAAITGQFDVSTASGRNTIQGV